MGNPGCEGPKGRELFGLNELFLPLLNLEDHTVEGLDKGTDLIIEILPRYGLEVPFCDFLGGLLDKGKGADEFILEEIDDDGPTGNNSHEEDDE